MTLGPYLLGPRLAVGGMGEVFLATRKGLGEFQKPLVLKLLLPHLDESPIAVQMFLDEARLAARMSHGNVVQIFDVGHESGRYFIAMELVRGVAMSTLLHKLAERTERLPPPLIAHVARMLCDGLYHAHQLRDGDGAPLHVVHRDVTPHNVLVSVSGEVKLADFGIAKARDSSGQTRPGVLKGKFEYLAPEQLREEPVDQRADVYGAGLTLYHLASLTQPFRRDSDVATLTAVAHADVPALAQLRPDLPPALVQAIARAMARDPADRFSTAREMREALPPRDADEDPEALGEWVTRLCGEDLLRIEQRTEHALAAHQTQELTGHDGRTTGRPWTRRGLGLAAFGAAVLVLAFRTGFPPRRPRDVERTLASSIPSPPSHDAPPNAAPPPPQPDSPTPRRAAPAPVSAAAARPRVAPQTVTAPPGYLTVDATPWASVRLAGRPIGDTPIARYPLRAGQAELELTNPDTGRSTRRVVTVTAGEETRLKVSF